MSAAHAPSSASMASGALDAAHFSTRTIDLFGASVVKYEWKNTDTGEVVEHDHWSVPPKRPGNWVRLYKFGLGRVEGGGGSPGRTSV